MVTHDQNGCCVQASELVSPSDEAIAEPLAEAAVDGVQPVIPEATLGLTDQTNGDAEVAVLEERDVTAGEWLVGDRTGRARVQAALSGVDDHVPLVVVRVDTGEDHRGSGGPGGVVDPGLEGAVEAGDSV